MIWMISARQSGTYTIDLDFPDGDMDKIEAEDMSIDIGRKSVRSFDLFQSGRRIKTEFLPKNAKRSGGTQAMYDLIMAHMAQICSEPCRDLIEMLDPGVHQFEEIKISLRSGEPEARRYFWFIPCTRLFALDKEKTTPSLTPIGYYKYSTAPKDRGFVFRSDVVCNHDIFCTAEFPGFVFCSDRFKKSVEDADMPSIGFLGPYPLS